MGSTFGAIHVRTARRERAVAAVTALLEELGFTQLGAEDAEGDDERRVLIFEDAGWVTIADEELDDDATELLGLHVSEALATDAIAIRVFHSDTADLIRYRHGEPVGSFQVPEGATHDEATGQRSVDATFLVDLVEGTTREDARSELATFRADYTFPEETVIRAASLVGIPHPEAGAAYLWHRAPPNATKLRFAQPEGTVTEPTGFAWAPPGSEGHTQHLAGPDEHTTSVGMPLYEQVTFILRAHAGERHEGIVVELSGPGALLLDVTEVAGWNPDLTPGAETEIMAVPLVASQEGDRGCVLRATFPRATVAPQVHPTPTGSSAAAMRAWQAALHAQSKNQFVFHLRGTAKTAGEGALVVRVTDLEGRPLDANEKHVALSFTRPARPPLLPAKVQAREASANASHDSVSAAHFARRNALSVESCGGSDRVVGWVGFDASFDVVGPWLLQAATVLGSILARAAGPLDVSVTTAGTHPTMQAFTEGHALSDETALVRYLASEADVELRVPFAAMFDEDGKPAPRDPSSVSLRHQPHGTTTFTPELREQLRAHRPPERIVPVDLSFSLSRAVAARDADFGDTLDRLLRAAAEIPGCVGGFVSPMGAGFPDEQTPYEALVGFGTGLVVDKIRARPRSPGWRVLVPNAAAGAIALHTGVTRTQTTAGVLLATAASDPFAMTDAEREAIERTLLPAFDAAV